MHCDNYYFTCRRRLAGLNGKGVPDAAKGFVVDPSATVATTNTHSNASSHNLILLPFRHDYDTLSTLVIIIVSFWY